MQHLPAYFLRPARTRTSPTAATPPAAEPSMPVAPAEPDRLAVTGQPESRSAAAALQDPTAAELPAATEAFAAPEIPVAEIRLQTDSATGEARLPEAPAASESTGIAEHLPAAPRTSHDPAEEAGRIEISAVQQKEEATLDRTPEESDSKTKQAGVIPLTPHPVEQPCPLHVETLEKTVLPQPSETDSAATGPFALDHPLVV